MPKTNSNSLSETPDIGVQWDRLCERNRIARRIRGVRQFIMFVMWSVLVIACGLIVAGFASGEPGFFGGAIGGCVLALALYVVAMVLAGQIEALRLLVELWG